MIVFETAGEPLTRIAEEEVGGRRIAGRLLPYGGEAGEQAFRFDPVARRFVRRRPESAVTVGPARTEPWRAAAARLPAGPVLVGPGSVAEAVRGAQRAAAEGALAAGRAVFLLDPQPEGMPESSAGLTVLSTFSPGGPCAFPSLRAARSRDAPSGVLFPLIPGWTAEAEVLEALLCEAEREGARSATPIVPDADGESRRSILDARSASSAPSPEDFFDRIHHQDWPAKMPELLRRARARCAVHGLAVLPPRPSGRREPAGNAAASARLEERAELDGLPEHREAVLRAAVRWIDECGRDLAAVAREGNFRKVFPFDGHVAAEAEAALEGAR